MSGEPEAKGAPHSFTDEERARGQDLFGLEGQERRAALDWIGDNLPRMQRSAFGQRLLYQSLGVGLVAGLAAYVGGYFLKESATTGALGLLADLLYSFGWALWTGAVVVLFLQVIPEVKRRQFKQALDAYEAAKRDEAPAGGSEPSAD